MTELVVPHFFRAQLAAHYARVAMLALLFTAV